jgi:hypothetical protein
MFYPSPSVVKPVTIIVGDVLYAKKFNSIIVLLVAKPCVWGSVLSNTTAIFFVMIL